MINKNNNLSIYKAQVRRDYYKRIHAAHTHTHEHTDYTELNLHTKRAANRDLNETDEDSSAERKTWL